MNSLDAFLGLTPGARLYAITPDWTDTPHLLSVTEAIFRGGCRLLQYRNKAASPDLRQDQAVALRQLATRYGARLIINDDLALARRIGADGVHLGQEDGDLASARGRLEAGQVLGASCYDNLAMARLAVQAGADYIAFGSFFASPTKPGARRADPALIRAAKATTNLPVAAIGGITLDNAAILVQAGADLLAVISALYNAPDPRRASQDFCQLLTRSAPLSDSGNLHHDLA